MLAARNILMTACKSLGPHFSRCGERIGCYPLPLRLGKLLIICAVVGICGPIACAQESISAGKASFDRVCGLCHGPQGKGDIGPPLVPMTHERDEVLDIAREGRGMMPPVSSKTISDDEILNVWQYLKSLSVGTPSTDNAQLSQPHPVLQLGLRVERAAIAGDLSTLANVSVDASVLLTQSLSSSDKKLVYCLEAYANWQLAVQTTNQKDALTAIQAAEVQIHEALALDDKFSEADILEALIEAEAFALNPKESTSSTNVASILDRARILDPKNPRLLLAQGIVDFRSPGTREGAGNAENELKQAGEQFEKEPSAKSWPNWGYAETFAWLGQVLQQKSDVNGARQSYQRALAIQPDYKWVSATLLPSLNQH